MLAWHRLSVMNPPPSLLRIHHVAPKNPQEEARASSVLLAFICARSVHFHDEDGLSSFLRTIQVFAIKIETENNDLK